MTLTHKFRTFTKLAKDSTAYQTQIRAKHRPREDKEKKYYSVDNEFTIVVLVSTRRLSVIFESCNRHRPEENVATLTS